MKILRLVSFVTSYLSHLLPLTLIYLALQPVANWYFSKLPILGVDFYNSVSFASILSKNLHFPASVFIDNWYAGYPLHRIFVSTHWYTMIPFINEWGFVKGIQIYVLLGLFLLIAASYILYFSLSKSRALSLLLAFSVLYSVNIYGSATWGGSLPFFATQFFLPLVILCCDKYIMSANVRWYWAGILVCGLGFLSHPLPMFVFGLPSAAIMIFCGLKVDKGGMFINLFFRFRQIAVFVIGSLLVAFPVSNQVIFHTILAFITNGPATLLTFVKPTAVGTGGVEALTASQGLSDVDKFYRGLVGVLYSDTNIWLFWLLIFGVLLFFLTFIFVRKKSLLIRVVPFTLMTGFAISHTFLNAYGFTILPQGWYREFWAFPILLGALAAVLWGVFFDLIRNRLKFKNPVFGLALSNLPFLAFALIFSMIGYLFITYKIGSIIETIDTKSEMSSAHPQALSIRTSKQEIEELKGQLLPSFINPDDKNRRLYEADALVNIWWQAFFNAPLVKGYADPPIGNAQKGGFFWLDIAIANDTIVRDFKVGEETAYNNALFLIDWYGIYYYEGGRVAVSASVGPSSYLVNNNVFDKNEQTTVYGALVKWETPTGKPELNLRVPQYLNFYKVRDELTSPVVYANNAPAVLVFSDFSGYEDFLRGIAASNINSKYLIPVNAGRFIDDYDIDELSQFDAIFLSNYDYHNKDKAFELLAKFARDGGKIFIDTGVESRESASKKLPEIFPINSSNREGYGKNWELEAFDDPISKDIKFEDFGPLIFNDQEWKLASSDEAIRSDAKVILSHKGKPVIVRYPFGSGEIVWSGMNLLYHMNQYKSAQEMRFFTNIVKQLVPINLSAVGRAEVVWEKPERIIVKSKEGARGILVKEEAYPSWKANLKLPKHKNLPIFKAGPTYPGFIYIPLKADGPFEVEIKYTGEFRAYFYYGLSFVLILLLLDKAVFNGFFLTRRLTLFSKGSSQKLGGWWERDEG